MELTDKKVALIFKALCDENRVQIMKLIRTGEKCVCKLSCCGKQARFSMHGLP